MPCTFTFLRSPTNLGKSLLELLRVVDLSVFKYRPGKSREMKPVPTDFFNEKAAFSFRKAGWVISRNIVLTNYLRILSSNAACC